MDNLSVGNYRAPVNVDATRRTIRGFSLQAVSPCKSSFVFVFYTGERNRLGGPSVAAYTPEGHLGVYTVAEYGQLAADRERHRVLHALREGLAQGEPLERVLERLQREAPRNA